MIAQMVPQATPSFHNKNIIMILMHAQVMEPSSLVPRPLPIFQC